MSPWRTLKAYTLEDAPPALRESLSPQQANIALLIANGRCDKHIETLLSISHSALRIYIDRIRKRWDLPKDDNVRVAITRVVVRMWAEYEYALIEQTKVQQEEAA